MFPNHQHKFLSVFPSAQAQAHRIIAHIQILTVHQEIARLYGCTVPAVTWQISQRFRPIGNKLREEADAGLDGNLGDRSTRVVLLWFSSPSFTHSTSTFPKFQQIPKQTMSHQMRLYQSEMPLMPVRIH